MQLAPSTGSIFAFNMISYQRLQSHMKGLDTKHSYRYNWALRWCKKEDIATELDISVTYSNLMYK